MRLIVEADGSQHCDSAIDPVRDAWFVAQGFRVRRFWNADILTRPTEVMDTLWTDVAGHTSTADAHDSAAFPLLPDGNRR